LRATTVAALLFFGWEPTAAADAPENGTVEAGLSIYGAMGRGAWIFASAEAAIWFAQRFSVGGYLGVSMTGDPMEADCSNRFCPQGEYKIGSRARLHVLPAFIVDPWLGVGIGGRFDVDRTREVSAIDASASLGADVRLGRVAVGPFGIIEEPLVDSAVWQTWQRQIGLGVRADLTF
jgi:hypothetical protein